MQGRYSKWLTSLLLVSLLTNIVLIIRLQFPAQWQHWRLSLIPPPQLTEVDHTRGPATAPTVIVYTNYQCGYCARLNADLITLAAELDFRLAYRHSTSENQPLAFKAASAAECAADQGKFWEYNDQLFINAKTLNEQNLAEIAQQLKLDMAVFAQCTTTEKYKDRLIAARQQAEDKKIRATPTIFINGERYIGAKPPAELKQLIVKARTRT
jgi:protein-disulfide isomerase